MASDSQGIKVGYIRVSSLEQNTARQLDGIELTRDPYVDHVSGKDDKRPELQRLLRDADLLGSLKATLYIHSMDRLARNMIDLRRIVDKLTNHGMTVCFLKEGQTYTKSANPQATLMLNLLGSFAEFERAIIRERQREGIALAKARGVYTGRKPTLSPERAAALRAQASAGMKKTDLAREFGVSRETVYKYLRQAEPAPAN